MSAGAALVELDGRGTDGPAGTVGPAMTAPQTAPQGGHAPQPPPDSSQTVRDVAALLLAGGAVLAAYAIWRLLRARGRNVARVAVVLACRLAERGTRHEPRMVGRSDVARAQRKLEASYRAAYIIAAAERLTRAVPTLRNRDGGSPLAAEKLTVDAALRAALARERRYLEAHERARKARMRSAAAVATAADEYGPLLGWYAHDDDRTTPECRAADGSNFSALTPPAIGWPGTLHGGTCRCEAGPPHLHAQTTDEATAHLFRGVA